MKKRILPALLALVIVLGLLPMAVFATGFDDTIDVDLDDDQTFTITITQAEGGTIKCFMIDGGDTEITEAAENARLKFVITANEGYRYVQNSFNIEWDENLYDDLVDYGGASGGSNPNAIISFEMISSPITVTAKFEKVETQKPDDPVRDREYTITIAETVNGSVTCVATSVGGPTGNDDVISIKSPSGKVQAGKKVYISATPNDGYVEKSCTVVQGSETVEVTPATGGEQRYFIMPAANVTVTVTFGTETEGPVTPPEPEKECTCETKCNRESKNNDCSICKELSDDFATCKGTEPEKSEPEALTAAYTESGVIGGTISLSGLTAGHTYICEISRTKTSVEYEGVNVETHDGSNAVAIMFEATGSTQDILTLKSSPGKYFVSVWGTESKTPSSLSNFTISSLNLTEVAAS